MLKHSENNPEPIPAAQMRVKSEDVAKAIAAIEARRQQAARALEGTIVIGDVINELKLDVSPEELLAEVESLYEEQPEPRQEAYNAYENETYAPNRSIPTGILICCAIAILALITWWGTAASRTPHPVYNTSPYVPPIMSMSPPVMPPVVVTNMVQSVDKIPIGQPFGCTRFTLDQILRGENPSEISVTNYETAVWYDGKDLVHIKADDSSGFAYYPNPNWTLVKYGKEVYVRGWVNLPLPANGSLRLFNTPSNAAIKDNAVELTLPTQALHYDGMYARVLSRNHISSPYNSLYSHEQIYLNGAIVSVPSQNAISLPRLPLEIWASNVHLDKHAYEKW